MQQSTGRGSWIWFAAGGVLGFSAAVLLAPEAGPDARRRLGEAAGEGRARLADSGRDLFERGREMYEAGRHVAEEAAEMYERGRQLSTGFPEP